MHRMVNESREDLGLSGVTPLKNAPPALAFTTVALGAFRGLIANFLWLRANELQVNGKYFEMIQLSEWITMLQPRMASVWAHLAWNLAYNISVKFPDFEDRWKWVQSGIKLLRDEGLQYNPESVMIHRELAWFFQHKLGAFLDDAHMYYKRSWAELMTEVLGGGRPDYGSLINPSTPEEKERAAKLRQRYKMDPELMREIDSKYGPLDWRLPEAHAIYWAYHGMQVAETSELIPLRRVIYQSMQLAFHRGRLVYDEGGLFQLGPNLDIIPNVDNAYKTMREETSNPGQKEVISQAHENFLQDAVYFLYTNNRISEARKWFDYLNENYPDAFEGNPTMVEYALSRVTEDVAGKSMDRITAIIQGYMRNSYYYRAIGDDDAAAGHMLMARKIYNRYQDAIRSRKESIGLPPFGEMQSTVLEQTLNPEEGLPPQLAARLRTALGMAPAEKSAGNEGDATNPQETTGDSSQ
ncbi:MAG: hypothetical protein K9N52_07570 [Verrucomicrobia bacterium]|nr:hypothetical protein [Verrucomicrobiota bacterium]